MLTNEIPSTAFSKWFEDLLTARGYEKFAILDISKDRTDKAYNLTFVNLASTQSFDSDRGDAWARHGGTIYSIQQLTGIKMDKNPDDYAKSYLSGFNANWTEKLKKEFRKQVLQHRAIHGGFAHITYEIIAHHHQLLFVEARYPMGD